MNNGTLCYYPSLSTKIRQENLHRTKGKIFRAMWVRDILIDFHILFTINLGRNFTRFEIRSIRIQNNDCDSNETVHAKKVAEKYVLSS